MRQHPQTFTAAELREWACDEEFLPGLWRPARPLPFQAFWWQPSMLKQRIKIAWHVFIGRYDAVNWAPDPRCYLEVVTGKVKMK